MTHLILFEDADILVVHKPSGINTHKPDKFAPDGLHEWLTKRGYKLSILQRLDKETSGVLVFGKSTRANQSLAKQFETHTVRKEYLLLSDRKPSRKVFHVHSTGELTDFEYGEQIGDRYLVLARPATGKTHQIRRHATKTGFPILGDTKYEGTPAPRLMLHAHRITFTHPASGELVTFEASIPAIFEDFDPLTAAREFRDLIFDDDTNAYRLINAAGDSLPGIIVDSYADRQFIQRLTPTAPVPVLAGLSVYEQLATKLQRSAPQLVAGEPITGRFPVRENGLTYLINFGEGLSTGLFLDQRENRRRLLKMSLAGKRVLNCFAYTCAFSVAAAKAGAVTTSVDLSKNYLDWGQANFRANDLDPSQHEFIFGDVFDWLKRFAKRGQQWDLVLLDPPTFSTTKGGRRFQAERDYAALAALAVPLVARGGTLFCSTNQRTLKPEDFEKAIRTAVKATGREIKGLEFETLPFDYRLAEGERPYLKTWWASLE